MESPSSDGITTSEKHKIRATNTKLCHGGRTMECVDKAVGQLLYGNYFKFS